MDFKVAVWKLMQNAHMHFSAGKVGSFCFLEGSGTLDYDLFEGSSKTPNLSLVHNCICCAQHSA